MRKKIYEHIKNNVRMKLNEDRGGLPISDIYEYTVPPSDSNYRQKVGFTNGWNPSNAGFGNRNPVVNQPTFVDPQPEDPPPPPQAPIDRGTFEEPTENSYPVIYREEPQPGSGQFYKYRLVNHPQLGWTYQRVPVPAGGAGFTWGGNLPVGVMIWNEDEAQFQKYTRPTGWDWVQDLGNFTLGDGPTRLAPSVPTPRR